MPCRGQIFDRAGSVPPAEKVGTTQLSYLRFDGLIQRCALSWFGNHMDRSVAKLMQVGILVGAVLACGVLAGLTFWFINPDDL